MSAVLEFKAKCEHGWTGSPSRCRDCRKATYKAQVAGNPDTRKTVILTESGRVCLKCKQGKSWNEFGKDKSGYNQKTATCKKCIAIKARQYTKDHPHLAALRSGLKNRPSILKKKYGITYEDVVRTLAGQFGRCANNGCGQEISLEVKGNTKERAVIDHNHKTGKFRALLCGKCNLDLGLIEKNEMRFLGLMEYKTKHTENN